MKHVQYNRQPSYSFLLADGVAPFQVVGLVELTILFAGSLTKSQAHIARSLCADMILGMDYINHYNLNINVKQQIISIENQNRTFVMKIDKDHTLLKIPVITSKSTFIPPHSNRLIKVSNPISTICSSFIPTTHLHLQHLLSTTHTSLNFHNYCSNITFCNTSSFPKFLSKGVCVGFMFCRSVMRSSQLFPGSLYKSVEVTGRPGKTSAFSDLFAAQPIGYKSVGVTGLTGKTPECYDLSAARPTCEKLSGVSEITGRIPALLDLFTEEGTNKKVPEINNFSVQDRDRTSYCNLQPHCNTIQILKPRVEEHIRTLVSKIENKQRQDQVYSVLNRFYRTFDVSKHNIADTPIHHVINTVPHSPPACRPYPQPDKEEAMYKLIQEFLQATGLSLGIFTGLNI